MVSTWSSDRKRKGGKWRRGCFHGGWASCVRALSAPARRGLLSRRSLANAIVGSNWLRLPMQDKPGHNDVTSRGQLLAHDRSHPVSCQSVALLHHAVDDGRAWPTL